MDQLQHGGECAKLFSGQLFDVLDGLEQNFQFGWLARADWQVRQSISEAHKLGRQPLLVAPVALSLPLTSQYRDSAGAALTRVRVQRYLARNYKLQRIYNEYNSKVKILKL
jgi:hypothetical protein